MQNFEDMLNLEGLLKIMYQEYGAFRDIDIQALRGMVNKPLPEDEHILEGDLQAIVYHFADTGNPNRSIT
jgi:hypothetical protein